MTSQVPWSLLSEVALTTNLVVEDGSCLSFHFRIAPFLFLTVLPLLRLANTQFSNARILYSLVPGQIQFARNEQSPLAQGPIKKSL